MARPVPGASSAPTAVQSSTALATPPAGGGFLAQYQGANDIVPEQPQISTGSGDYLAFLSTRGDNAEPKRKMMEQLGVGEGHAALVVGGEPYDAQKLAFVVLDSLVYWGVQGNEDGWGTGQVSLEQKGGDHSTYALALTMWLPGTHEVPKEIGPACPLMVVFRKQHAQLLAVHIEAVRRAATPRFLEGNATLARLPAILRMATRITTRVRQSKGRPSADKKPGAKFTMCDSSGAPAALTVAQVEALMAANGDAACNARLATERSRFDTSVALVREAAEKGTFLRL